MLDPSGRGSPASPLRRRWPRLAGLAGALLLTLLVTACAGGQRPNGVASLSGSAKPTATTTAGGTSDRRQAALQFARCMRQHGIDVPDPGADSGIRIRGSEPDDPEFKAAEQACQRYAPDGGKSQTVTGGGSGSAGGDDR